MSLYDRAEEHMQEEARRIKEERDRLAAGLAAAKELLTGMTESRNDWVGRYQALYDMHTQQFAELRLARAVVEEAKLLDDNTTFLEGTTVLTAIEAYDAHVAKETK